MFIADTGHRNGHNALAVYGEKSSNHGRVALPRDRFIRSSTLFSTRKYSTSAVNRHRTFFSPEGWRALAGGNTPGNHLAFSHSGGVPENVFGHPISPIRPIRLIPHPKSTIDLGREPLIKVNTTLSPTRHKPIIRPENKGIKPITNLHKPKNYIFSLCTWCQSARTVSFVTFCKKFRSFCPFCRNSFKQWLLSARTILRNEPNLQKR